MTIIIQPYYFWKGHYKRYFKALVKNNSGICVGAKDKKLKKNNIYFLKPLFSNYEKNGCYFLFSRLFNSLKVLFFLFSKFFFNFNVVLKLLFISLDSFIHYHVQCFIIILFKKNCTSISNFFKNFYLR